MAAVQAGVPEGVDEREALSSVQETPPSWFAESKVFEGLDSDQE